MRSERLKKEVLRREMEEEEKRLGGAPLKVVQTKKKISQLGPYRGKCELVELCILSIPTPSACAHIHHVNIPTAWPSG